ncbi:MAG TPA: hypothetical protein VMF90_08160 [Rhizobiaceae bacterium]|nr:hypothetical protein [Rhizobiaceae bacterium]
MRNKFSVAVATLTVVLFAVSSATAETGCGICAEEVVINSDLAGCFLEKYQELAAQDQQAVIVDLSECQSRGVIEAIPGPDLNGPEPETRFMLTRAQLDCLKTKLEEPGLVLDPSAVIDLDACG